MVIVGRHFDQIDAHHLVPARDSLQDLQHFVIQEPAMAGRAGARRDGRAEPVNVDGDVKTRVLRDACHHRLGAKFSHLAHRENVIAHPPRRLVPFLRGRGHVADAKGRDPGDMILFGGAAHRVAVAMAHAMADIDEIQMGIDLQDMDRAAPGKGADAGDVHRMITADGDGQGTCVQNGAHPGFDIGVAGFGIGMHDIGIADVYNGDIRPQIDRVILMVIGARMAEGEQSRGLAHRARAKAGTGAELRAEIERRAKNGGIGPDRAPILHIGAFAKGGDADKGKVQASGFVGMRHAVSSRFAANMSKAASPWQGARHRAGYLKNGGPHDFAGCQDD